MHVKYIATAKAVAISVGEPVRCPEQRRAGFPPVVAPGVRVPEAGEVLRFFISVHPDIILMTND